MADDDMIREQAHTAIRNDPTISDPTRIVVSISKKGPLFRKRHVVSLEGRVRAPMEVQKAEDAVRRRLPYVTIENNVTPQ